ncbi:hypothetical protein [Archangium lansingense]|uniref:Uncharacterized protein n=1 Tax=Archangium lansingense TaxID=2995310 RepID=A0ABT4A6K4_9BACT|nr:hypothetical protein [Archangium lansinium]MCY1077288.1 hypothetical protein [Archangium lansinium]
MASTALGAVRYANTWRLPAHQAQVKTSNANVLRSSFAWSTRGIRFFFGSLLTAASGAALAPSSPAWGRILWHRGQGQDAGGNSSKSKPFDFLHIVSSGENDVT